MLKKSDAIWIVIMLAALVAAGGGAGTRPATLRMSPGKLSLGEEEVRQLVCLMDTDRNGKVSKQEVLKFMEAELDRLDANRNGELDVNELRQSRIRADVHPPRPFTPPL